MFENVIKYIKSKLDDEVCPHCGSKSIIKHGFEGSNLRYECKDCGITTYIDNWL